MRRLLTGLLLLLPAALPAQTHTVRGVVRSPEGDPIPGAEVLLESPRLTTTTDAFGAFRLDNVPAGNRRLLVRRIGFLAMHPRVKVPQAPGDSLVVLMLQLAQELAPIVVETGAPGVRGVVGDTGFRALPGTIVELIGSREYRTTDSTGRFAFQDVRPGHYMLRVSRQGYVGRLLPLEVVKRGQEFSILLREHRVGEFDWANSREAAVALPDLSSRLAMEPRRTRMTRAELARYGTMPICEVPRVRSLVGEAPSVIMRGVHYMQNADLCAWTAEQLDLVEFGADPCRESWKSIADVLGVYCGPSRAVSLYARVPGRRSAYVVLWPGG